MAQRGCRVCDIGAQVTIRELKKEKERLEEEAAGGGDEYDTGDGAGDVRRVGLCTGGRRSFAGFRCARLVAAAHMPIPPPSRRPAVLPGG